MEYDELKLEFGAVSSNEAFARSAAASFIAKADPEADEAVDIRTAVSEAVTNCIVHAYGKEKGKIYMTVRILPQREIAVHIRDKGCGIEDIEKAMTPLYTSAPDSERAGLGFAVMESFMDSLRVRSTPGKGTTVIMKKKLR